MIKKSVPGIDGIKKMESLGDFDVDKIVGVIDANKDIIHKVEVDGYSVSIYLNLSVNKKTLVDGLADMFNRFGQSSADLVADNGVRILKFWWDSSARNF